MMAAFREYLMWQQQQEQARQEISTKYADIQVRIDNADTVEAVKEALA